MKKSIVIKDHPVSTQKISGAGKSKYFSGVLNRKPYQTSDSCEFLSVEINFEIENGIDGLISKILG